MSNIHQTFFRIAVSYTWNLCIILVCPFTIIVHSQTILVQWVFLRSWINRDNTESNESRKINSESKKCGRKRSWNNFIYSPDIWLLYITFTVPSEIRTGLQEGTENAAAVKERTCRNCYAMRSLSNLLNHSFPCFTGSLFPLGISAQIYAQCISRAFPLFLYSVWVYWNKSTELLIVLCTSRCQDRSTFLLP